MNRKVGSNNNFTSHLHNNRNYSRHMAEWGKGDPRWIVEDRPDGKKKSFDLHQFYT